MNNKGLFKKWVGYFTRKASYKKTPVVNPDIDLWEEDYLVKKIQNQYADVPEEKIRAAVKSCYLIFRSPQSGEKLMQCVKDKIKDP